MVTTPTTPTHAHLARSSPPGMAAPSQPPAIEPFETLSDDFVAQSTPTLSHAPMPSAPNPARQPLEATVPMLPPSTVPPSTDSLETNHFQKPSGKRVLMEAAPIQELRPAKKQKADGPRPPIIDVFAPIIDNGKKPAIHYAALITLAILRSPQQKLTLSQIYKWITDTFSFYRGDKTGWQNSIRHNLSLNKYFHKQQRPKDDPGKGHYWTVEPGAEYILLRDKPSRKGAAPTAENMPVMSTRLEPSQFQPQLQLPCMAQPMLISQLAPAPPLPEIPSDATIPASDPATIDEGLDRPAERDPFQAFEAYPPLPVAMHSSPPIPRRMEGRYNGTPPSRRHGRSFINDSGYLSSLESSAMRPNQYCNQLLTSEADRPRIRQGRAEVEIARLRGSPYDSPSNGRSFGYAPVPSSPMQPLSGLKAGRMPPPLTPAPKLTAPPMAPPSASPSTNLRLHRQNIQSMVESPFRRVSALLPEGDFVGQQTPGLQVDHLWEFVSDPGHNTTPGFDIHEDASDIPRLYPATPSVAPTGSPMKRSTTRQRHQPRPERWQSSGVLKDVTNTARNLSGQSPASFLKVNQTPNLQFETPSKAFDGLPSSPSKVLVDLQSPSMPLINNENLDVFHGIPDGNEACYMFEFPNFEDDDTQQFDMLAGYQRIGSSGSNNNPTGHGSGS